MTDEAESSRRSTPMTPPLPPPSPPPPSPAIPEHSNNEAISWAASDDCSSSTPHTDLLSLWMSNYMALPQPEAEEEPLVDVPTLLNFDLESSFPDLVDWNTTSAAVTQAPVVTQPLWVQLHAPTADEEDDLSRLTLGIQSPKPSILPLPLGIQSPKPSISPLALEIQSPNASILPPAPGIQFPEASISPVALGIQPPPSSFEIQSPQASISPLALGIHPLQASSRIETLQASVSPLALGIQSSISPLTRGIQFPQASILPSISPLALGIQSPQTSFGIQPAPASFSLLQSIPCTLPMAPHFWNFRPSPFLVPECRSWSVFPSTPPPDWRHLLLPHSESSSVSSASSHQTHHFFPAANTGYQQQVLDTHAPVTFSTPNASANSIAGFAPASRRLSWSEAMAPRGSWIPNQPCISNGQDMKLPIPRRPRFLLPRAAATMHEPPPLLANFGSSDGNMPNWNARGDVPVEDHKRVQTEESSRPSRKRSKLAVRTDNKLKFK